MKLLDVDWREFLQALNLYHLLPVGARRFFIDQVRPSQPVAKGLMAQWRDSLIESGLMVMSPTGSHANVRPEYRDFSRAIRAMGRSRVLDAPGRDTFQTYLNDNLTPSEMVALQGPGLWGRLDHYGVQRVYSTICSVLWSKQFLAAKSVDWEREHMDTEHPPYLPEPGVLKGAQNLIAVAAAANGPVTLRHLAETAKDVPPEDFSASLRAAFRYLLLFPSLRPDDLEPIVGLWAGVAEKLSGKPPAAPATVAVSEPFCAPFLMDDIVVILSACAVEPIRLRSGDMQIFEAARRGLEDALGTLPKWMEESFLCRPDRRVSLGLEIVAHSGFVKRSGRPGEDFRLEIAEAGSQWLALQAKERLKALFDGLRGTLKRPAATAYDDRVMALAPGLLSTGRGDGAAKLTPAVLAAYSDAPGGDKFIRVGDFLNYQVKANNALAAMLKKDRYSSVRIGAQYINSPSDEEVEAGWKQALYMFLHMRLAPLGGVRMGIETGGNAICFSMTDAGRYLLGTAKNFEIADDPEARILVQPNFEVVFLEPSARVEAELARFCERKGRGVGTLFRITKNSILGGAAAGLTADRVLGSLRDHCAAGLPANVESEIKGWFGRYREVKVRPAMIIHCPDAETAARLILSLGGKVTRLTDTVLELHEDKIQAAVAKKLRETGIFVRS